MVPDRLKKPLSVLLALALWQWAAVRVGFDILLSSPLRVAEQLWALLFVPDTWATLAFSLSRIALGFGLGAAAGVLCAVIAGRFSGLDTLLWPYVTVMKSVPVASFIIIALIWLDPTQLSSFIAMLMVFPIVYTNLLEGIRSADRQLLEMAKVYRLGWGKRLWYIYLPHLRPYLLSACSVALGLSWKSGVAAEVIGIADGTIGERLYEAKVNFATAEVLAWTVLILAVSIGFEKLVRALLEAAFRRSEKA